MQTDHVCKKFWKDLCSAEVKLQYFLKHSSVSSKLWCWIIPACCSLCPNAVALVVRLLCSITDDFLMTECPFFFAFTFSPWWLWCLKWCKVVSSVIMACHNWNVCYSMWENSFALISRLCMKMSNQILLCSLHICWKWVGNIACIFFANGRIVIDFGAIQCVQTWQVCLFSVGCCLYLFVLLCDVRYLDHLINCAFLLTFWLICRWNNNGEHHRACCEHRVCSDWLG